MAAVDVICPGSEPECFHYLLGQVILGHRGVNLDDAHPEVVGFLVKAFREHPITFEQIVQGPLRLAGLPGDLPQGAPPLERDPTEPFDDHTGFPRKAEEVFDDQVEAFAPKPVERLEHGCRRSVHPPLVHVHGRELAQKWAVFGCAAGGVLRHHIVCGIKTQTELSRYAACSSRLACATAATDPVDVPEPCTQVYGVGSIEVSFRLHLLPFRSSRVPSTSITRTFNRRAWRITSSAISRLRSIRLR